MKHHQKAISNYYGLRTILNTFMLGCRYDPVQDRWLNQPKLNRPRFALSAAAAHGALYAVGGFNGEYYMSTVEMYDPRVGRCAPLPLTTFFSIAKYNCHSCTMSLSELPSCL